MGQQANIRVFPQVFIEWEIANHGSSIGPQLANTPVASLTFPIQGLWLFECLISTTLQIMVPTGLLVDVRQVIPAGASKTLAQQWVTDAGPMKTAGIVTVISPGDQLRAMMVGALPAGGTMYASLCATFVGTPN